MGTVHISPNVRVMLKELFGWHVETESELSYGFDFIDISPTDNSRLSGIEANKNYTVWPSNHERENFGTFLKPGKFLRAIKPELNNNQISSIAAKLRAHMVGAVDSAQDRFQITNTPSEIYRWNDIGGGTLGSSCMNNRYPDYFVIYDESPSTQMLYLLEDGQLRGRALLHNEATTPSGDVVKFMDRVYVANDNDVSLFFRWATENGYWRKRYQNFETPRDVICPDGISSEATFSVPCVPGPHDYVPYVDTFYYYCECDNILHNTSWKCHEDTLRCLGGESGRGVISNSRDGDSDEGEYAYICYDCECGLYEGDDYTFLGDDCICGECLSENYSYCDECCEHRYNDSVTSHNLDGDIYPTTICEGCLENYYICFVCGNYHQDVEKYVASSYSESEFVCEECATDEEMVMCEACDKYHPKDTDECPNCRKIWREGGVSDRVFKSLVNRVANSPMAVKNNPGMFLYREHIYELKKAVGSVNIGILKEETGEAHSTWSLSGDKFKFSTYTTYYYQSGGFRNMDDIITKILGMVVETRVALMPIVDDIPDVYANLFAAFDAMVASNPEPLFTESFPSREVTPPPPLEAVVSAFHGCCVAAETSCRNTMTTEGGITLDNLPWEDAA